MPEFTLSTLLQLLVGLGLINVWLVRANRPSPYRGGDAQTLEEEFQVYGLPPWVYKLVGVLKVGSALALIVGMWVPSLVDPAAMLVIFLMLSAIAMHAKVKDPPVKYVPAAVVLMMAVAIVMLP